MNLVVDQVMEEGPKGEKHALGMVVIRGNSIVLIEVRRLCSPYGLEVSKFIAAVLITLDGLGHGAYLRPADGCLLISRQDLISFRF